MVFFIFQITYWFLIMNRRFRILKQELHILESKNTPKQAKLRQNIDPTSHKLKEIKNTIRIMCIPNNKNELKQAHKHWYNTQFSHFRPFHPISPIANMDLQKASPSSITLCHSVQSIDFNYWRKYRGKKSRTPLKILIFKHLRIGISRPRNGESSTNRSHPPSSSSTQISKESKTQEPKSLLKKLPRE